MASEAGAGCGGAGARLGRLDIRVTGWGGEGLENLFLANRDSDLPSLRCDLGMEIFKKTLGDANCGFREESQRL